MPQKRTVSRIELGVTDDLGRGETLSRGGARQEGVVAMKTAIPG